MSGFDGWFVEILILIFAALLGGVIRYVAVEVRNMRVEMRKLHINQSSLRNATKSLESSVRKIAFDFERCQITNRDGPKD